MVPIIKFQFFHFNVAREGENCVANIVKSVDWKSIAREPETVQQNVSVCEVETMISKITKALNKSLSNDMSKK